MNIPGIKGFFEENRRCGLFDTSDRVVIPAVYGNVWISECGVVAATLDKKIGCFDPCGKQIIHFGCEDIRVYHADTVFARAGNPRVEYAKR